MTIIESIQDYMKTYPALETGSLIFTDHLDSLPINYAIIPLPGEKITEKFVNDNTTREFPFAFQAMLSTADEAERLESNGFFETLAEWFETQTDAGTLPTLAAKKTAESIEAMGWGYLSEEGQSDTGIYQIQCKLTYMQEK